MMLDIRALAERLADNAVEVCAHYLSNGRRHGNYWLVGDVMNTKGRSLHVRLTGPRAGKWTDEATGEHGDLIDLIKLNRKIVAWPVVRDEIMTFLCEPRPALHPFVRPRSANSQDAAGRLFASARPLRGTLADIYLQRRGINAVATAALAFHPSCFYRESQDAPLLRLPALLARVTSLDGTLTGLLRIYLAADGRAKAAVSEPRLAMGNILGHGARFGEATEVLAAGEGVETMLALQTLLPTMPMVAALSAGHLGALQLPPALRRLYIAMEPDTAGKSATERLSARAFDAGIAVGFLTSVHDDWNTDLLRLGVGEARARALRQLMPEDLSPLSLGCGNGDPPQTERGRHGSRSG